MVEVRRQEKVAWERKGMGVDLTLLLETYAQHSWPISVKVTNPFMKRNPPTFDCPFLVLPFLPSFPLSFHFLFPLLFLLLLSFPSPFFLPLRFPSSLLPLSLSSFSSPLTLLETRSLSQTNLQFMILLPQLPKYWIPGMWHHTWLLISSSGPHISVLLC